jgi:hypothetical protein
MTQELRMPALQVQSPEFKLQFHQKEKERALLASFVRTQTWQQSKCLSTVKQTKCNQHIHALEYYLAMEQMNCFYSQYG